MFDKHIALEGSKELKVKIAARLHLQLHSMKILHGKPIQDTVAEALQLYFAERAADEPAG